MSLRRSVRRSRHTALTAVVASSATIASLGALTGLPTSNASVDPAAAPQAPGASTTKSDRSAQRESMGNYDSRTSNTRSVLRQSAELLRSNGPAIRALGNKLGDSSVLSVDPLTGTPDNVARLDGFLTSPSSRRAADIALGYVRANLAAFGLSEADLSTLTSRPETVTDISGIRHVSWTQSAGGVPVFGNGLRAHVTKDGSLISVQGAPVPGLSAVQGPDVALTAGQARELAADDVSGEAVAATSSSKSGATRDTTWSNGDKATLVYFATADGVRAAWSTYTHPGPKQAFQHVIDAETGRTLYRHSTINNDKGDALVYDQYPGAARGGEQRTVNLFDKGYLGKNASWLKGAYAFTWSDINDDNEVQESEKTKVPGTNGKAQFKLEPFQDATKQCTKSYICTWDPNEAFSWQANRRQDATQGFVLASRFHDYLQAAPFGFTPQMGNFERDGGDPLLLHVLDGANTDSGLPDGNHIDNANMETPPDGVPPTMQMFLNHVPGTTAQEDPYLPASSTDAADNIYHEYVHGLSNRLVVDADGNSTLNSLQAGSMGEAWSDYYAMDFLVTKGLMNDGPKDGQVLFDRYLTKNRAITRSQAIDCAPDARARLCEKSVGAVKGGYTYGDLGNATGGPEVHADGEIWAQTLWDLRDALGHKVTGRLVTAAMSISPNDPSFLDERDAILLADRAVYGGTNADAIWRVFADRGMGWFASSTDSADTSVVEDFHMRPGPRTPKRVISGTVTDDATGDPIQGAVVKIPGHASGVSNYADVTDADGEYSISKVLAGRYPELVAQAPAYDVESEVADLRAGDRVVDFELRRDWAASAGGAEVVDFTGPDYGPGCGPDDVIDLNFGEGWSTPANGTTGAPTNNPVPALIEIELPRAIDVLAFGVDPSNTCGDAGSASTGAYRIEVASDGNTFNEVKEGRFTAADRGRVNELPTDLEGVTNVRFWIDSSQVPIEEQDNCESGAAFSGCQYMDLTELEVYGKPSSPEPGGRQPRDIQILSFNDYHGHLEATDAPGSPLPPQPTCGTTGQDAPTCVGGVEYLATHVERLRAEQSRSTLTVAAGDLIGGSTFLSGLFQDQPSVESLNELGLDVSSVGNHEFDEGLKELKRMVKGGCQPAPKGCFKDADGNDIPYGGADFAYLGANVVKKTTGDNLPWLPGTTVKTVRGIDVGFIGMTLEATDTLVNPVGVSAVDFEDEVETANAKVARLKARGVETIVVLLHEGGYQVNPQTINSCNGISDPIKTIAQDLDAEIDLVVTGHTHQPYICSIDDPDGDPRLVTSAAQFGQVLTETHLLVDPATGDVLREESTSTNNLVTRDVPKDAAETAIIDFWKPLSDTLGNTVVGKVNEDITGNAITTCRCEETPMADLVADAILFGTQAEEDGGAQIALMNTGGVRDSLLVSPAGPEAPGEVTYREAYNVAPFNNILVTVDLTGAQIEAILEQQYQRIAVRGSRPMLSLGVSAGFTYTWVWEGATPAPNTQPTAATTGAHVENMALNGVPLVAGQTYRVGTLNFLADGGDSFTAFSAGTDRLGGPEDLANLVAYLEANKAAGLSAPPSRINGL